MNTLRELLPQFAFGLPTHALVLHAAVVLVPLTCLLVLVCAFSDTARRRAGVLLPVAGLGSLALVVLGTFSGEALMARLPPDPVTQAHGHAGEAVEPWALGLALVSVALWWVPGRARRREPPPAGQAAPAPPGTRWRSLRARSVASVALPVLATTAAVGTGARIVHAGHLGAQSTWGYVADLPAPAGR